MAQKLLHVHSSTFPTFKNSKSDNNFLNNGSILKVANKIFPILTKSYYFLKSLFQEIIGKHVQGGKK